MVLFGVGWLAMAAYTYNTARAGAESAASVEGVDAEALPASARSETARRRRLVAAAMAALGAGFVAAGIWL